jgi:hypothetical protein
MFGAAWEGTNLAAKNSFMASSMLASIREMVLTTRTDPVSVLFTDPTSETTLNIVVEENETLHSLKGKLQDAVGVSPEHLHITHEDGSPFLDSHFPSLWLPATTPEQKTPELQFSTTLSGGGRGIQVGIKNVIFFRACATPTCNCAATTCCMFLHCGGATIHGKWHHPLPCHLGCGFSCFGGCFGLEFGKSAASLLKKKYGAKDEAV